MITETGRFSRLILSRTRSSIPGLALAITAGCSLFTPDKNLAPRFLSTPDESISYYNEYYYRPVVEDPNGDEVTISINRPAWMAGLLSMKDQFLIGILILGK